MIETHDTIRLLVYCNGIVCTLPGKYFIYYEYCMYTYRANFENGTNVIPCQKEGKVHSDVAVTNQ